MIAVPSRSFTKVLLALRRIRYNANQASGFRRGWATYESIYLLAKLSTLLIIAFIDPDNCVFRTFSRGAIGVTRQAILLITMVAFFILQCITAPFIDPASNASEFISRVNYVATAALSMAVALNAPGQAILEGPVLYMCVLFSCSF